MTKQEIQQKADTIIRGLYEELAQDTEDDPDHLFSGSIDLPTLAITKPEVYQELTELKRLYQLEKTK